jgi:hypothetical protein
LCLGAGGNEALDIAGTGLSRAPAETHLLPEVIGVYLFLLLIPTLAAQEAQPLFDTYTNCARCHSSMRRPAEAVNLRSLDPLPVGPAALWRGSMMAHSSRDPYWQAKMQFEMSQTPAAAAFIEDTCLRCHAPQQHYERRIRNATMRLEELNDLGREGVGCTVCHQITPENLGAPESFTGGFTINEERAVYGPHADPFSMPMEHMAGYTPRQSMHLMESKLCATCHTVITPALNERGERAGEYVEQAPYLEWLRSSWAGSGASCQSCHMPRLKDAQGTEVAQYIAHNPMGRFFPPTSPRRPFGLHTLAGANITVLSMLKDLYPDEAPALDRTIAAAWEMARSAAGLKLFPRREQNQLHLDVQVFNYTGHKLPTGFPSRRVWLHLKVSDGSGKVVFESGAWDESGEIRGLAGSSPHRNEISNPTQVAIYESEPGGADGRPTTALLRVRRDLKDNRLLPRGYDAEKPLPEGVPPGATLPVGTSGDPDFLPGSDTVHYRIAAAGRGPLQIQAQLLYQSIRPSFVRPMRADNSAEERTFLPLYRKHASPITLAGIESRVE